MQTQFNSPSNCRSESNTNVPQFNESFIRKFMYYNNHLKYGFGPDFIDYEPRGSFKVKVGELTQPTLSPLEESRRAAQLIFESTRGLKGPIRLMLSGGVDSECMCEAFYQEKIPFIPTIISFTNDLNWHDIKWAVEYCQKRNLDYEIFEIDPILFYESAEVEYYVRTYQCTSPQLAAHLFALDQIDGIPVFAGQFIRPYITTTNQLVLLPPLFLYFCINRYFIKNQRLGVSHFFLYTSELIYSFFHLPTYQKLLRDLSNNKYVLNDIYDFKSFVLREGGFEFDQRPNKYTGFELIKDFYHENYVGGFSDAVYDNLYRTPNFKMILGEDKANLILNVKDLFKNTSLGDS